MIRKVVAVSLVALVLAGCSAEAPVEPTATPTPTESESSTPEPTPVDNGTFSMPSDCTGVLPADRAAALESEGIVLLAGPGGIYGLELITDPTPEMLAGGISCYYGYDNEDVNQLKIYSVVSVAPVSTDTSDAIVSDLVGQGMNASTDEVGNSTYSILGDSDSNVPAQYNLMTNEAWISVISILGGETFYRENVVIAGETLDNVYN
ncbi:MAG: hypothetical protein ACKOWP_03945 [Microbacteriaceae bacterium]